MKRILRTLPGKSTTFFVFVLSAFISVGSVIGAALMANGTGYNFYAYSEDEIIDKLTEDHFSNRGYNVVWDAFNNLTDEAGNLRGSFVDSNYYYVIKDDKGKTIWETADNKKNVSDRYTYEYAIQKNSVGKVTDIIYKEHLLQTFDDNWENVSLKISPKPNSPVEADFMLIIKLVHIAYSLKYSIYAIGLIAFLLAIASFITLMSVAGHRPDTEEIIPGPMYNVPIDLILGIVMFLGIVAIYIGDSLHNIWLVIYLGICFVLGLCVALGLCLTIAVRIKLHTLLRNTVIYRAIILAIKIIKFLWGHCVKFAKFIVGLARNIPLVWKTALVLFGVSIIEFLIIAIFGYSYGTDAIVGLFFLEKILLIPACIYVALCLKRLAKAGEALAGGDLSFVTDTKGMLWDLKKHGENLNNIASGMAIAVEDRMKSERMRTELITNVSHDIKTPLTSIINYATLIGNEHCENEKITEYSEVLVRQSERMKRLIEDLVEASKASTGNIEVNLAPCDASVFITQASGEYEDKLKKAELTLVTKQPEEELRILSDGRRMWRVFDNLMNNICKYAQSGTRVYLSLERLDDSAVFTFKNTSREALDMSEEELMERFTRGDASRNTEGNGLGLSIAKSMAELQNGELKLSIDGDLFKAMLKFPVI